MRCLGDVLTKTLPYDVFDDVLKNMTIFFQRWNQEVQVPPIAQMADIGFKVVLLERLNQKWKQKHF